MTAKEAYIDSNVIFYAIIMDTVYGKRCGEILREAASGGICGTISTLVIIEVANAMKKYGLGRDAKKACTGVMSMPFRIVPLNEQIVHRALAISHDSGMGHYDSVHLATMEEAGLSRILTADKGFEGHQGVTRLDPLDSV